MGVRKEGFYCCTVHLRSKEGRRPQWTCSIGRQVELKGPSMCVYPGRAIVHQRDIASIVPALLSWQSCQSGHKTVWRSQPPLAQPLLQCGRLALFPVPQTSSASDGDSHALSLPAVSLSKVTPMSGIGSSFILSSRPDLFV